MVGRLAQAFALAKDTRRLCFVPYVMAGDPDLETTEALIAALSQAGADAIELGIPYSDPLADGPTIAAAGARALANGTRLIDVLDLVRRCAAKSAPLLLFTYFNPVYRYGIERFAQAVADAGAAGAIVPDLSLEESTELRGTLGAHDLEMPLLVAPSTTPGRAQRIADARRNGCRENAKLRAIKGATARAARAHRQTVGRRIRVESRGGRERDRAVRGRRRGRKRADRLVRRLAQSRGRAKGYRVRCALDRSGASVEDSHGVGISTIRFR
jgi:tryptophan synthase alpha subunit